MSWVEAHIYYRNIADDGTTDGTEWVYAGTTRDDTFTFENLIDGKCYEISIVTANFTGNRPAPEKGVKQVIMPNRNIPVPLRVPNVNAIAECDVINFSWGNIGNGQDNAEGYELRKGELWANAVPLTKGISGTKFDCPIDGLGPQTYLIKGVNKFDSRSPWAEEIVVNRFSADAFKLQTLVFDEASENWVGSGVNTEVLGDLLAIASGASTANYTTRVYDTGDSSEKRIYVDFKQILISRDLLIQDLDFTGDSKQAEVYTTYGAGDQFQFEESDSYTIDEATYLGDSEEAATTQMDGGLKFLRTFQTYANIEDLTFSGTSPQAFDFVLDDLRVVLEDLGEACVEISLSEDNVEYTPFDVYVPGKYTSRYFQVRILFEMFALSEFYSLAAEKLEISWIPLKITNDPIPTQICGSIIKTVIRDIPVIV